MALAVNAGARLDRLPISSFHYRIFWLVGAGMFFDGYDLYVAGGVLASTLQSKFSTLPQNLQFISLTFVGMTIGALVTGFLGDWFGRQQKSGVSDFCRSKMPSSSKPEFGCGPYWRGSRACAISSPRSTLP